MGSPFAMPSIAWRAAAWSIAPESTSAGSLDVVLLTVSQLTTGQPELLRQMFYLALCKGKRLRSARLRQSHLAFFRLPVIQQIFYLALFKSLRLHLARLR